MNDDYSLSIEYHCTFQKCHQECEWKFYKHIRTNTIPLHKTLLMIIIYNARIPWVPKPNWSHGTLHKTTIIEPLIILVYY